MKTYDVLIIGGGPAGVAAAKVLKDNNISYAIIDKEKFPRQKLCGGGLTFKSTTLLKKLGLKYSNISNNKVTSVRLVAQGISKNMPLINNIFMIDRYDFDYNNIKQVTNKNLFEAEKIIKINGNILETNKNKFKYKYIIFADGVNGYSRKLIKDREFGFCVEYTIDKEYNETIFDFSAIDNGYGWVFPKVDHTVIGLGIFYPKKVDYIDYLLKFAKKNNFKIDKTKIRGYHIPTFSKVIYKNSIIDNNKVIVGDAASLVDSVSGEGIYYALYSGMAAAESIVESIKNNTKLSTEYFSRTKDMCKELEKRRFLSKLLYSKRGLFFIKLGLSNKVFIKKIHNLFG